MTIFSILNFIKIIIGGSIIYLTCNYINLNKDFLIWLGSIGIGGFILIWGISYFIILVLLKIFNKKNKKIPLDAYKYSGLFSAYILSNFLLMAFNFWNKGIGFILLIIFIILGLII